MEKGKKLKPFNIFTMTYGAAIGSGIFLMTGIGIAYTGKSVPWALLLGAFYAIMTELYILVICSFFPFKGGYYDQISFVGTPVIKGVLAISTLTTGFIMASFATGAVDYMSTIFPVMLKWRIPIAVCILLFFTVILRKGAEFAGKLQNVMTVVLIISLFVFIILGIFKIDNSVVESTPFLLNGPSGFIGAAAILAFTCMNAINTSVSLASETENARKVIPKYTLLGVLAVIVTYFGITYVASHILPIEQVAGQNLDIVAGVIFSTKGKYLFIVGGAVFGLLTSLIANLAYLRYPLEVIAEEGWFPKFMNKRLSDGYPIVMMGLCVGVSIITVILNISLDNIITMVTLPILPLYVYATIACLKLPKKYPELWKKNFFHMPYPLYAFMITCAAICTGYYMYSYITGCNMHSIIISLVLAVLMYGWSYICIKTGRVDKEKILDEQQKIVDEVKKEEQTLKQSTK